MINADFCSGAVLISFGAVLGKTSPIQLLLMALFEVTLFGINEFVLLSVIGVSHTFHGSSVPQRKDCSKLGHSMVVKLSKYLTCWFSG